MDREREEETTEEVESWKSQEENIYQDPAGRRTLMPYVAESKIRTKNVLQVQPPGGHWNIHT